MHYCQALLDMKACKSVTYFVTFATACCPPVQAVLDPFIWIPNGLGGLMSIFLVTLTVVYPAASLTDSTGLETPLNKYAKDRIM